MQVSSKPWWQFDRLQNFDTASQQLQQEELVDSSAASKAT